MGKRSTFKRKASDLYRSPEAVVLPLLPHIQDVARYAEPCAANGRLVDWLAKHGKAAHYIGDKVPGRGDVVQCDALDWVVADRPRRPITHIITNSPWRRDLLHPMITRFSDMRPTWLLFDADWLHTRQAAPFLGRLEKVVSVGRVKWIEGSAHAGKDNCAWYLFDARFCGQTAFYGRTS